MSYTPTIAKPVQTAFEDLAPEHRETLLYLRELIFEVAASDPRIGPIEETLRWGEPAYITVNARTGSTIRLSIEKASGQPALFFNCKTTLVEDFRQMFGTSLQYSKNRAVIVDKEHDNHTAALKICITAALTYHLRG